MERVNLFVSEIEEQSFQEPEKENAELMDLKGKAAVVCGGGGFIGGHLVNSLLATGVNVIRAVDIKPLDEWYQVSPEVENLVLDLKDKESCYQSAEGTNVVFQLEADMGGMGFIENNKVPGSEPDLVSSPGGEFVGCNYDRVSDIKGPRAACLLCVAKGLCLQDYARK